jgi:ABC-type nitrate/sulfonate/bicarbonate transport system substrate-binding protein
MRWAILLLSALVAIVPHSTVAQPSEKKVITVAHAGPISPSVSLPLAIAQEHGIFAKHGLDVRLIGAFPGAARLIGKEAEFGYFGSAAILLAITEYGTELRILGAINNGRISFHLLAAGNIKKPEDLRGKRIGVFSIGTGIWVASIQVLQHLGVDPVRDEITFVPVGNVTAVAKALEEGRIDAGMLTPVQSREFQAKGFSVLFDANTANMFGAQSLPVTTAAYLGQNPDTVERFSTALVEAIAFSLAPSKKPDVLKTLQRMFNLPDTAAAEQGYADLSNLNRKPYASIDSLKGVQSIVALHDRRILDVKIERLIEDRFLRKLDESGQMDRLYAGQ